MFRGRDGLATTVGLFILYWSNFVWGVRGYCARGVLILCLGVGLIRVLVPRCQEPKGFNYFEANLADASSDNAVCDTKDSLRN